ncbi:MAG TPA: hypothetical protein VF978_04695 [Gemmatimonadales bacterium]
MTHRHWLLAVLIAAPCVALSAQVSKPLDSTLLAAFRWRPVGPANMAGRITDVEGIPGSRTFFFAAASGGVWKTTNAGTTFRPVFDHERVTSMGDLAIAPSDTNIVWAGTGEEDSRNSISPGGGIYKSTDGGLTWKLMGLTETQAIGRIVIHPRDPNVVYVAAVGAPWNANRERGLYKTTDGGQNWQLVKFISDRAGFVDLVMDPANPDVLFAASWERVRGPWFLQSGGPGSALWKTADGGKTWTDVTGGGFPATTKGRIGIAIAASDPKVIYALVEADTTPNPRADRARPPQQRPSGLYRSADGGQTWERTATTNVRPFYYSQVRVDPKDPNRVYWSSTPVNFSNDGGKTLGNATVGIHVDHHAMWIDPMDPSHIIVGNDGGIAITWDQGGTWDFPNVLPLGQFYAVSYDFSFPYKICGGLQDNGSWCAPSRRPNGITNADWVNVGGGDGFVTAQDPNDPDIIYVESQGGNMSRLDFATGERTQLQRPQWRPRWTVFEDSIVIERPDTARPETAAQRRRLDDLRRRQRADSTDQALRFNWSTPFLLSQHNPRTFYAGASKVLKSTNRGENLMPISPDLTTRDTMKIRISTSATGGITPDITGAETHCTIVALAESPFRPGVLYAGTDDGKVWLTRNDGGTWEDLTGRFPGVPANTYVSRVEPSRFDSTTFYVTFDNHRRGDYTPYVFVTTDFGRTFRSIAGNLPTGGPDFVHVIREDPENRDLLFVGTDVGVYASLDRGKSWQRFMAGLPTVPVHDLKIHPRDHELIAGTHGRSIWVVDIAPLEQLSDAVLAAGAHLFEPQTAYAYGQSPLGGGSAGHKVFRAQTPPPGAEIAYRLTTGERRSQTRVVITDAKGDTVRVLTGPGGPGLHRASWDFRATAPAPEPLTPSGRRDSTLYARRMTWVFDSLGKAGWNARALDRIKTGLLTGDLPGALRELGLQGGGGGGGGGGSPLGGGQVGRFVERPGESAPRTPGGRAAAPGGGERAEAPAVAQQEIQQLGQLLRLPGRAGGGGFGALNAIVTALSGNRGPAPLVATGDFLVSITVEGKTLSKILRVERVNGTRSGAFAGFTER